MPVPDRSTFESAYAGHVPWAIGRPLKAFMNVAVRITGSLLDAGCDTGDYKKLTNLRCPEGRSVDSTMSGWRCTVRCTA